MYFSETDFYSVMVLKKTCALPMRLPNPSQALDKTRAPVGPEMLSSTGAGVWKKAPGAFPDSSYVLDKFRFTLQRALSYKKLSPRISSHPKLLQVLFTPSTPA